MPRIPLLELSEFDFSNVGAGLSVLVPLRQAVDVLTLGTGTLCLRAHAAVMPAGASLTLELNAVAPTMSDPAAFFRGPLLGVAEIRADASAPTLSTGYALLKSGQVAVSLRATQGPAGGTFTGTLSAELAGTDACDGWTPLDLGSKLTLWLDQRDQTVVSGAVSDWGDQSSAGDDFNQNLSSARRPLTGATINLLDAPSFDGVDDYLELVGSAPLGNLISSSAYHVFAVARFDTITANKPSPFDNHVIFGDISAAWTLVVGTPGVQGMHWDSVFNRPTPASPVTTGTAYLIEWSFDGATIRCRVGSGAEQSIAATNVVSVANTARLGFGTGSASYLDGCIGSVVCCNQYLSRGDAASVRSYLSSVYGVPA